MNLKSKSELTLLTELKTLVTEEREVTAKILHYFREIETRKTHLERGYPSLFEFAVKELGYSAGGAHRRISAMRLLKALPEFEEKIQSGELSLSVAARAQNFFREEAKTRTVSVPMKREVVESLLGLSTRECEKRLAEISPAAALPKEKERVVTDDLTQIQFLADRDLMEKLEKLKGLLAHQNFDGGYQKLFHQLADMALKKLTPAQNESRRHKVGIKRPEPKTESSRENSITFLPPKRSRTIPARVKAAVYKRDDGKCVFRDRKTGRNCGSTHAIEYDHAVPFSMGGDTTAENLRLLCSAHHRLETGKLSMIN